VPVEKIEYEGWDGERSSRLRRVYTMAKKIFRKKISSKGILLILIIGMIITHFLPIVRNSLAPHEALTPEMMAEGYLGGGLFVVFSLLFASIVCSDVISRDLEDNSFMLYFSRPLKAEDYLLGKLGGAFSIIGIFSLVPPIIFSISVMATQSGGNYLGGLEVLITTMLVGIFTTYVFTVFGVMISSMTERRTYAGVGAFASFFVLSLVGGIFQEFDPNWQLIDPVKTLHFSYDIIYGFELPPEISPLLFGAVILIVLTVPLTVLYYRIKRRSVGK